MAKTIVPTPRFRTLHGTDYRLDSVQRAAKLAVTEVNAKAVADKADTDAAITAASSATSAVKTTVDAVPDVAGKTLTRCVFQDGEQREVLHGLGKTYTGWKIVRDYGANPAQIVEVPSPWPTHHKTRIVFTAIKACTVDILVW